MFEQNIRNTSKFIKLKSIELKTQLWDNKTIKLTILFIIAALLITSFALYQYQKRHYAISAYTQKQYNQERKSELNRVIQLNNKWKTLKKIDGNTPFDNDFFFKIKEAGVPNIQHQMELLSNCTKQYMFDQNQRKSCQETYKKLEDKLAKDVQE